MNAAPFQRLNDADLASWEQNGFLGPFTAWTPEEVKGFLPQILSAYQRPSAVFGFSTSRDRHLDSRAICDVGTHPTIIKHCAKLFGTDLLLWRTNIFHKRPGAAEIILHQDRDFPGTKSKIPAIVPGKSLTAWLALTATNKQNGCVKVVPESHREWHELKTVENGGIFGRGVALRDFSGAEPKYMELEPGQFFLFSESVVHGSDENKSDTDRIGIAFRFTPTSTKVYEGLSIDSRGMPLKRWHSILVSGEDRYEHNRIGPAPLDDNYPNGPVFRLMGRFRRRFYQQVHGMD